MVGTVFCVYAINQFYAIIQYAINQYRLYSKQLVFLHHVHWNISTLANRVVG